MDIRPEYLVRHQWSVVPELMKVYLVTTGSHLDLLEQAGASIMVSYGCCHRIVHQILPLYVVPRLTDCLRMILIWLRFS